MVQVIMEEREILAVLRQRKTHELIRFKEKLIKIGTPDARALRFYILKVLADRYMFGETYRIARLKSGNWKFGHEGTHRGIGSEICPIEPHHHHDEFCFNPSNIELMVAGIFPGEFKVQKRV